MKRALILVDIQNDFLPGGALAVPEGDEIIPVVNKLMPSFELAIATQDWHPANHGSFAANHPGKQVFDQTTLAGLPQTLWPVHCVQNTPGAEFARTLDLRRVAKVIQKGTDPAIDSYSGFFDNGHRKSTGLLEYLREADVTGVFIAGLATDYCVKATAIDARASRLDVTLIEDACRGVNLGENDVRLAIDAMRQAGVTMAQSGDLINAGPVKR